MSWHYVVEGQKVGPVSDAELQNLVAAGTVRPETLVWREGMSTWEPYAKVGAGGGAGSAPQAATSCSQCGRPFLPQEMIRYEGRWVCAACKPTFVQRLKEGVALPTSLRYGGFWIRVLARIIDGIILAVVNGLLRLPFVGLAQVSPTAAVGQALGLIGGMVFLNLGVAVTYETLFLGRFGATPGKMACRLKVVRADGSPLTYGRAFGRYWGYVLSGFTLGVGYIMAAFTDQKRALHDFICDTRVVKG
jgi:uncharacterized RDD family membrane protein YckC